MLILKPFVLGRSMLQVALRTFYFHSAYEFLHSHTRISDRLLGPCFKTGRKKPFSQNHRSPSSQSCPIRLGLFWHVWLHFVPWMTVIRGFCPPTPFFHHISFYRFLLNDFRSFHSLFKVLFIVPSQYFFAIGLPSIFSFGRFISPA